MRDGYPLHAHCFKSCLSRGHIHSAVQPTSSSQGSSYMLRTRSLHPVLALFLMLVMMMLSVGTSRPVKLMRMRLS